MWAEDIEKVYKIFFKNIIVELLLGTYATLTLRQVSGPRAFNFIN